MQSLLGRRLGDILDDPDNGFGVLRLIAALAVVFSHSYFLTTHVTASEPLFTATGFTLGQHAVHAFFIVSGLLVTASLFRTPTLLDFLRARALRVFPALLCCTMLTAFVVGPLVTSLPFLTYLSRAEPYLYVMKTAGLATGHAPLPGVFDANPATGEINIPVWTLKYEVVCYVVLAAFAVAGVFRSWVLTTFAVASIAALFVVPQLAHGTSGEGGALDSLLRLGFCFSMGVTSYVLRDRLRIGLPALLTSGVAYFLCIGTGFERAALIVLTATLTFTAASVSFGAITRWARGTDVSYGAYIYGWPLMQLVLSLFSGLSPIALFVITLSVLLPTAYLSWRFIEKPVLSLKRRGHRNPQLSALRQRIVMPRPPVMPGARGQLDTAGEALPPPPSKRRILAAIRARPRLVSPTGLPR